MFRRFLRILFKRERPRVYLGTITVVPRADFKRYFEHDYPYPIPVANLESEEKITDGLAEIFALPLASEAQSPTSSDLVLDVVVPHFQLGHVILEDLGKFPLFLFWRPRIEVRSRLRSFKTQKPIATFAVKEKLPWGEFVKQSTRVKFVPILSLRRQADMDNLLNQACVRLIKKMVAKI